MSGNEISLITLQGSGVIQLEENKIWHQTFALNIGPLGPPHRSFSGPSDHSAPSTYWPRCSQRSPQSNYLSCCSSPQKPKASPRVRNKTLGLAPGSVLPAACACVPTVLPLPHAHSSETPLAAATGLFMCVSDQNPPCFFLCMLTLILHPALTFTWLHRETWPPRVIGSPDYMLFGTGSSSWYLWAQLSLSICFVSTYLISFSMG